MAKRVYFAFRYQDVIDFRANVVRKHNFLGSVEFRRVLRPFDLGRGEEDQSIGPKAVDKRGVGKHHYHGGTYRVRNLRTTVGVL
jgi:hypothetical protein